MNNESKAPRRSSWSSARHPSSLRYEGASPSARLSFNRYAYCANVVSQKMARHAKPHWGEVWWRCWEKVGTRFSSKSLIGMSSYRVYELTPIFKATNIRPFFPSMIWHETKKLAKEWQKLHPNSYGPARARKLKLLPLAFLPNVQISGKLPKNGNNSYPLESWLTFKCAASINNRAIIRTRELPI